MGRLEEEKPTAAEPCIMVIFGATGDLTARKLIPALFRLKTEGMLPDHFICVGFARREKSHQQFRQEMRQAIESSSRYQESLSPFLQTFEETLYYHRSQFDDDSGYEKLRYFLEEMDQKKRTKKNRLYYLATPPKFFPLIIEKLSQHKLLYHPQKKEPWSRVIIEKPFGKDLKSAKSLQKHIIQYLAEEQIYRIDHYLGKETVQNLLALRFGNPFFEATWNKEHIDHIQISVAEDVGIGRRGALFEELGTLRDVMQNHMMQLISLLSMEMPSEFSTDAIHREKVKVLKAIEDIPENSIDSIAIRGQYQEGMIHGEPVVGYRQEANVSNESLVETYVALKLKLATKRFNGVPFYLRTGKRLPKRSSQISIIFKRPLSTLFSSKTDSNILSIRIQPNEGISLRINSKLPGPQFFLQPVTMDFDYESYYGKGAPEAYERLVLESMIGDRMLFAREDEVMEAWRILTPIIEHWQSHPPTNFPNYEAGTWGPPEADTLLLEDHRSWCI